MEVLINTLKRGTSHAVNNDDTYQRRVSHARRVHPWIGLEVLICRHTHARKGQIGKVIDIFPPRSGRTQPDIRLRIASYNPNEPYPCVMVEYDDVVEKR